MMDLNGFSCLSSNAESHAMAAHHVWLIPGALPDDGFETKVGVPYWTSPACGQSVGRSLAAQRAVQSYERLDGRGYIRGFEGDSVQIGYRLQVATLTLQALRSQPSLSEEGTRAMAASRISSSPLSEREAQILRCISEGGSNKEVARQLGISPSTVRTHVENMFRKLQCTTRAAATLKAMSLGLI
ncbi:UNVERIFIED_ORG: DNA-binding CsgD family transcriptional regulator [Pseudomonas lini]|uniref:LuxR C-terminal-related transcriptional regulator n=1 Tax=Pseudomonas viciae TaxID=2505979 RepID=A0ABY8P666_9PSED|nr:LuxR C-terminal-related transcriptional regulator [Pseudomonas viciae]UZE84028.1 LuxR C-terminal-related transcriptional regulator [Pseudomonas viciae]WGO90944.1 LuxR C-terminal-related transcriptional regulator [Pseudomonas viciae]